MCKEEHKTCAETFFSVKLLMDKVKVNFIIKEHQTCYRCSLEVFIRKCPLVWLLLHYNNSPSWQTPSGCNKLCHSCMRIKVLKADLWVRCHIFCFFSVHVVQSTNCNFTNLPHLWFPCMLLYSPQSHKTLLTNCMHLYDMSEIISRIEINLQWILLSISSSH